VKRLTVALLLLIPFCVTGYETVVESDEVRYNGEIITLTGNVSVENAMGKVTSKMAILKKDEEKKTKIDFPWIELKQNVTLKLADGGILRCDSLSLDYTQMTSFFYGSPQVTYIDTFGEIYADKAQVDYREVEGTLEATKVTLFENVRLVNRGTSEKPASQYALADELCYFPQEKLTILTGKQSRVLFYDQERALQLSARTVHAQRDPVTKKESVHGVGDVRFIFGPEELEKIKHRFQLSVSTR
jgi:lipopolysaccharide export system protein LptA